MAHLCDDGLVHPRVRRGLLCATLAGLTVVCVSCASADLTAPPAAAPSPSPVAAPSPPPAAEPTEATVDTASPATTPEPSLPTPPADIGFSDDASRARVVVGLDRSSSDYGDFAITAPGMGMVWPRNPVAVDRRSAHAVTMTYNGPAFINRGAKIDGTFALLGGFHGPVHLGHIRVVAQLDPSRRTGFLELWVGGKHRHFQFAPAAWDADKAMRSVVSALSTSDFSALYDLVDSAFRDGVSRDEFVARFTAAMGNDSVVEVRRTGPVSYSTTSTGIDHAAAPARATVIRNGKRRVLQEQVLLIREDGEWRFDTTRSLHPRQP